MRKRLRKKKTIPEGGHYLIKKSGKIYPIKVWVGGKMKHKALIKWARNNALWKRRVVAREMVAADIQVSTVFLGLDHGHSMSRNRLPLIYETMIFGGKLDQEMWRYRTKKRAIQGHRQAVELAKRTI